MNEDKAREAFEQWAESILGDSKPWRESGPYELAWQSFRAALQWAASQQAAEMWRPIETAPKDGTEIIACQSGTPEVGLILWEGNEACWLEPADEWSVPNWLPDHWMPLPSPPSTQGQ